MAADPSLNTLPPGFREEVTVRWETPGSVRFRAFNIITTALSIASWGGHGTETPGQAPPPHLQALACPSIDQIMTRSVGFLVTNHGNQLQLTLAVGGVWGAEGPGPLAPRHGPSVPPALLPSCWCMGVMSPQFQDGAWAWGPETCV